MSSDSVTFVKEYVLNEWELDHEEHVKAALIQDVGAEVARYMAEQPVGRPFVTRMALLRKNVAIRSLVPDSVVEIDRGDDIPMVVGMTNIAVGLRLSCSISVREYANE